VKPLKSLIKTLTKKVKGKKKPSLEARLRKRLNFLEDLEKKIKLDMESCKPSEMASLREEFQCLETLIAEFKAVLKG
jgi:uncharacterized protein YicC (UPF0701 family)